MATIQGIYLALFGRPADPAGLAYWMAETNDGADLSGLIGRMTGEPEALLRFEGLTNEQVVTTIYQALFGRDPDAAGLADFVAKLESGEQSLETIAINILDGAQGEDAVIIANKIAAANNFTASLDTPEEIAAYQGEAAADAGRAYIDQVTTDPETIPTEEEAQGSIDEFTGGPGEGQGPGGNAGGGKGGGSLDLVASVSNDGTLIIADGANATIEELGAVHRISAPGFRSKIITPADDIDSVEIGAGATLHVDAGFLAGVNGSAITGAGVLDITGVTVAEATLTTPVNHHPEVLRDVIPDIGVDFLVNGNEADAIKTAWEIWDDSYVKTGYDNEQINEAFVRLGARYAEYLDNGGEPFTDFTAKLGATRDQNLHDNLLGNINKGILEGRDLDAEPELLDLIPDAYETRPWFSGDFADYGKAAHDAVRAFDYAEGWDRADYIDQAINASLDLSARDGNEMYAGDGNAVTGFNIVRHEGAGVEIALKAKERGGSDYLGSDVNGDGIVEFHAPTGQDGGNANRADWNFDFAITSGVNANSDDITDFDLRLLVDVDTTAGTDFLTFYGREYQDSGHVVWYDANGNAVIGDDGFTATTTQNSQNYGFGFIRNHIDADPAAAGQQPYNFGEATFDVRIEVWDGVDLVGANQIQVLVGL